MFVWVKVMALDCCGRGGETVELVEASSERRSGGVGSWKDIMGGGGGL